MSHLTHYRSFWRLVIRPNQQHHSTEIQWLVNWQHQRWDDSRDRLTTAAIRSQVKHDAVLGWQQLRSGAESNATPCSADNSCGPEPSQTRRRARLTTAAVRSRVKHDAVLGWQQLQSGAKSNTTPCSADNGCGPEPSQTRRHINICTYFVFKTRISAKGRVLGQYLNVAIESVMPTS